MGSSIQDYLKKINSTLTLFHCLSLLITMVFLVLFSIILSYKGLEDTIPVSYQVAREDSQASVPAPSGLPFGSIKGKTYTFAWCSRSSQIALKNRVYYENEEQAVRLGKTLSKGCQK